MRIRCLGCAGGYPLGDNGTTSFVVSDHSNSFHILLDAGSGSALAIERYMDVNDLNAVIISHDHADHIADLGIFQHLFMLKQPTAKHAPVPIYLHPRSVFGPMSIADPSSELKTYNPDAVLTLGPFDIRFCQTVHPLECYAMRLEERATGQVLVFTADSGWCEALSPFSEGADWLIADCAFPNERGRNAIHMTAEEVATLANAAQVKHLIASHIAPQADATLIMQQIQSALDNPIRLTQCRPGMLIE